MPKSAKVFSLFLAAFAVSFLCAAQGSGKPAAVNSGAAEHALSLAGSGHCPEALPLLSRDSARLADKPLLKKLLLEGARCATLLERWDSLSEFAHILEEQFPHDPDAQYVLVHAFNDLATQAARQLANSPPNTIPVYELDAEQLEQQGKWDDAEKNYRKILMLNPRYPGIHFRLARILLSRPDPPSDFREQARKELEQELAIDPANAGAEFILGQIALGEQSFEDAALHLRRAIALQPGFGDAYLGLGISLVQQKKYEEAIAPLEKAVKLLPAEPTAHYNLGTAYARTGHKEEAQQQFALVKSTMDHGGLLGGVKPPDHP